MNNPVPSKEPAQSEVLYLLEKEKRWMTSDEVRKALKIDSRDKAAKFLRRLWDYDFLERRKREASVELEYRYLDEKTRRKLKEERLKKKNGQEDTS